MFTDLQLEKWQEIVAYVLVALIVLIFIAIVYLIIKIAILPVMRKKRDFKTAEKAKQLAEEKKILESEKTQMQDDKKKLEEEKRIAEEEILQRQAQLEKERQANLEVLAILNATKKELNDLEEKQKISTTEIFEINEITKDVLESSKLIMREDITDYRVPQDKTMSFNFNDVVNFAGNKPNVIMKEGKGKMANSFKAGKKTFLLAYDLGDGQMRLTFKCGPNYAQKLQEIFEAITVSKFPYGIIWFSADNNRPLSFEVVKQAIDISYKISEKY